MNEVATEGGREGSHVSPEHAHFFSRVIELLPHLDVQPQPLDKALFLKKETITFLGDKLASLGRFHAERPDVFILRGAALNSRGYGFRFPPTGPQAAPPPRIMRVGSTKWIPPNISRDQPHSKGTVR